jgi:hypothetical protein
VGAGVVFTTEDTEEHGERENAGSKEPGDRL